jgi:hypothetical protein
MKPITSPPPGLSTRRFGQHGSGVVHEAQRGDGQRVVERPVRERQRLGDGARHAYAPASRVVEHLGGRIDAELDPERRGEASGADADLEPAPLPGQQRAHGEQLRQVGGAMALEPVVVAAVMQYERLDAGARHGSGV